MENLFAEEEADFSPSSVEIIHRRCSCSDHHQKCGCCLQIRAPAFQNYEEADGKYQKNDYFVYHGLLKNSKLGRTWKLTIGVR